jgi:hypothetical protein
MRIAICISGQPRTWDKCYKTWNKFISKLNETFDAKTDVFCHAWDFNTPPNVVLASEGEASDKLVDDYIRVKGVKIPQDERLIFLASIKPVSYLFESEEISKTKNAEVLQKSRANQNEHGVTTLEWAGSQFYGVMRAAALKKKYEMDHGFRYDMCIRLRYDLFLDDKQIEWFFHEENTDAVIPKYNTLYSCHTAKDPNQFPFHRLGDVFWFADSITFDRICDFVRWLPIIGKRSFNGNKVGTEHALYFYAKMLRMNIYPLSIDPKVYRQSDYLERKIAAGLPGELGHHELI